MGLVTMQVKEFPRTSCSWSSWGTTGLFPVSRMRLVSKFAGPIPTRYR